MAKRPGGVGRVVKKKAKHMGREWLKRLLTALVSMLLSIFGTYSYAQTGKVIPRRELLSGTASFHFIDLGQGDATLILTGDAAVVRSADKLILPGVGAFGDAAEKLRSCGLWDVILEEAAKGKL